MERSYGKFTERARAYIDEVSRGLERSAPASIAAQVRQIVVGHDRWRNEDALSLNAAENVISETARSLLNSDMATRVTEGFPGHKDFPADRQNRFVDQIEATMIHLLRQMFGARHVEWRPVSTSMANATVFFALTQPGDLILAQPENAGGNYSYNECGPPLAARLKVEPLPFIEDTFELDVGAAIDAILQRKPKIVAIGGSNVLFPYPLAELRKAADEVGAVILYDAAHVALYIAHGMFQDPLNEGAHLMSFSSHKLMSGAVGGVLLTNEDSIAKKILPLSFPTFIQTRDQNKFAASAHALAEMMAFGDAYARATLENARALATSLEEEGFEVLCRERDYTQTHQIFLLISPNDEEIFEDVCQRANLLVTRAQRMGSSNRAAIRLSTQEITRRGLTVKQMPIVARWLRRVIKDRERPELIAVEVKEVLRDFQGIRYSFDEPAATSVE